jgi:Zn-dependent M16 (insulinase) family peptidase
MSFEKKSSTPVLSLQATIHEYEHTKSGAIHIHLETAGPELCFLVALPTLPYSNNGVAHILEHTTLCGSMNFPVRDPFFAMLKRSTSTFMNAITYPDRTVYPFATQDVRDFDNLLNVYLDAVFNPKLEYADFLQEGWRLEETPDGLKFQGVVLNEMKDFSADPISAAINGINGALLKGTPYEYESGGLPSAIPSLTYEQLREFHMANYSPSQAVFMSSGPVDVIKLQKIIAEKVLLESLSTRVPRQALPLAAEQDAPKEVQISVPHHEQGPRKFGYITAWRLGATDCIDSYLKASLLEGALLGSASSPVTLAIEAAGFGYPSQLNGLSNHMREMVLYVGMTDLTKAQAKKAGDVIWKALVAASNEGVSVTQLRTILRDITFEQRSNNGGHMPKDLESLSDALPFVFNGKPAAEAFNFEESVDRMKCLIEDPEFFKGLVLELLLNPNRVHATVVGDPEFVDRCEYEEKQKLTELEKRLTESERNRIRQDSEMLREKQRQKQDTSMLPRITPGDVSKKCHPSVQVPEPEDGLTVANISACGIVRASVGYDISGLSSTDWQWCSLYAMLIPKLGIGEMDYQEADEYRQALSPVLEVSMQAVQSLQEGAPFRVKIEFEAEGLQEEYRQLAELLNACISSARFDEVDRIGYIVSMALSDLEAAIAGDGDSYAASFVASPLSPMAYFNDLTEGVESLSFAKYLANELETPSGVKRISKKIAEIHKLVLLSKPEVLVIGDSSITAGLAEMLLPLLAGAPGARSKTVFVPAIPPAKHVLHAAAQVNHCEIAWKAPKIGADSSGAFEVLSNLLTNEVLHRLIREEGGAYGAVAEYDPFNGIFKMSSNRDPNLESTYKAFGVALQWGTDGEITDLMIEEAIICSIKDMDRPRAPHEEVRTALKRRQIGLTDEMRNQFRTQILECNVGNIRDAARMIASAEPSKCAFAGQKSILTGMEPIELAF